MKSSKDPVESFSIQDFKKWMSEQAENEFALDVLKKGVGTIVGPKVGLKRIVERMEPEGGDAVQMAREFKENGGRVTEVDGNLFMVEVANGAFIIPRSCVRKRDD